jgi:hypothetical protein
MQLGHGHDMGGAGMFFTGGTVVDGTTGQTGKWGQHAEVEEQGVVWFEAGPHTNPFPCFSLTLNSVSG